MYIYTQNCNCPSFNSFYPSLFLLFFPQFSHTTHTEKIFITKKKIAEADRETQMGYLLKEEKTLKRVVIFAIPRWIKILFFLINMLISLFLFSAPIVFIIADAFLPSALLSASLPPSSSLTFETISSHFKHYDFRYSLIDIPLISISRSLIILCVYSFCDGPRLSRGPYLGVATVCSVASLVFVSLKGSYVWMNSISSSSYDKNSRGGEGYVKAMEVGLFISSFGLAIGHVVVAYRTSCRERRKLLIYNIDIESVSARKNGFPRYQKILQLERSK